MNLRRIRLLLGGALVAIGATGFLGGFMAAAGASAYVPSGVALPLGAVQSWHVDTAGNIYLALAFYGRVQQYDAQGRYIRGWAVPTSGGPLTLASADPGEIAVYAARPERRFLYDTAGQSLGSISADHFPEDTVATRPSATGGQLEFIRSQLWPQVVHHRPDGTRVTLIQPTLPWWLLQGPLPVWGLLALGFLLRWWGNPLHLNDRPAAT